MTMLPPPASLLRYGLAGASLIGAGALASAAASSLACKRYDRLHPPARQSRGGGRRRSARVGGRARRSAGVRAAAARRLGQSCGHDAQSRARAHRSLSRHRRGSSRPWLERAARAAGRLPDAPGQHHRAGAEAARRRARHRARPFMGGRAGGLLRARASRVDERHRACLRRHPSLAGRHLLVSSRRARSAHFPVVHAHDRRARGAGAHRRGRSRNLCAAGAAGRVRRTHRRGAAHEPVAFSRQRAGHARAAGLRDPDQ